MRLNEGKIGKQESVSLIAIAMVAATTYLLDSEKAYSKGNSTFISLVLSIVISAAAFMLVCSVCNSLTLSPIVKQLPTFKYCPNCGARMDGDWNG